MSEANPTPGPWSVFNHSWCETSISAPSTFNAICLLDINHATEESQESDEAQMAANARLIADAGTVHHQTGLTPSQLVARVSELEGVLREAIDCGMVPKSSVSDGGASKHSAQVRIADKIRSALAKSTEAK